MNRLIGTLIVVAALCTFVSSGRVAIAAPLTVGNGRALQAGEKEFGKGAYPVSTPKLVAPRLKDSRPAKYVFAALKKHVQGLVNVDVVVLANGDVGDVRLSKQLSKEPLHSDQVQDEEIIDEVKQLKAEALKAVKQWTYEPGVLNGTPVAVVMVETVSFRIH